MSNNSVLCYGVNGLGDFVPLPADPAGGAGLSIATLPKRRSAIFQTIGNVVVNTPLVLPGAVAGDKVFVHGFYITTVNDLAGSSLLNSDGVGGSVGVNFFSGMALTAGLNDVQFGVGSIAVLASLTQSAPIVEQVLSPVLPFRFAGGFIELNATIESYDQAVAGSNVRVSSTGAGTANYLTVVAVFSIIPVV